MKTNRIKKATEDVRVIREFVNPQQLEVIGDGVRGEEKEFFLEKLGEFSKRISEMPKTYEQDGKGDRAVAYLHYFKNNCDWYITEKDTETDDEPGQLQAFGLADLGMGYPEMGYINIQELLKNGVELDLHFEPTTLSEIRNSLSRANG